MLSPRDQIVSGKLKYMMRSQMCYGVSMGENNLTKAFKSHLGVQINVKLCFLRFISTSNYGNLGSSAILKTRYRTFWIRSFTPPTFENVDFLS